MKKSTKKTIAKVLVITAKVAITSLIAIIIVGVSFNKSYSALRLPMEAQLSGVVYLDNKICSGFVVHPGYVMTAAHCLQDKETFLVTFPAGYSETFTLVEAGEVDYTDFALLKGETRDAVVLPLDDKMPIIGDVCASVGYGGRAESQMISPCQVALGIGFVSGYLSLFADIIPGDSGSAVISMETQKVIGISVRSRSPIPVALATPIRYAKAALQRALAKEYAE